MNRESLRKFADTEHFERMCKATDSDPPQLSEEARCSKLSKNGSWIGYEVSCPGGTNPTIRSSRTAPSCATTDGLLVSGTVPSPGYWTAIPGPELARVQADMPTSL